jgi:hypothetical protein
MEAQQCIQKRVVGYFESESSNIVGFKMAQEFGVNVLSA